MKGERLVCMYQVWVSSTSVAYLGARYSIPSELLGNIAGIDVVIEKALTS